MFVYCVETLVFNLHRPASTTAICPPSHHLVHLVIPFLQVFPFCEISYHSEADTLVFAVQNMTTCFVLVLTTSVFGNDITSWIRSLEIFLSSHDLLAACLRKSTSVASSIFPVLNFTGQNGLLYVIIDFHCYKTDFSFLFYSTYFYLNNTLLSS